MLVLITYDVSVVSEGGQRRLRNIAKTCLDYGSRVQNSVFECDVEPGQFVVLKAKLLGKKGRRRVEHFGTQETPDILQDPLIL